MEQIAPAQAAGARADALNAAPQDGTPEALRGVGQASRGLSADADTAGQLEHDDSVDYFAMEGEKARLVLELRARMESQRAGHLEGGA